MAALGHRDQAETPRELRHQGQPGTGGVRVPVQEDHGQAARLVLLQESQLEPRRDRRKLNVIAHFQWPSNDSSCFSGGRKG